MSHPRLYWGKAGNDLTPALFELPISRNYQHGGWDKSIPFKHLTGEQVTAARTYDIFNENGWGRSMHFLSAWFLVITGVIYFISGIYSGHFRYNLVPRRGEFSLQLLWRDLPPISAGKCTTPTDTGCCKKLPTFSLSFSCSRWSF